MFNTILSNNKNLYTKFSRRKFLFLLASLPLLNASRFENNIFANSLKSLIGTCGVICLAKPSNGEIIACTGLNTALRQYTIGSLAKLVTATALLEENLISSKDTYYCKGSEINGKVKSFCWDPNGHGLLNIETALSESCNLFFKKYSQRIAPEDIFHYFKEYKMDSLELDKPADLKIHQDFKFSTNSTDTGLGLDPRLKFSPLQILSLSCILAENGIYRPLWLDTQSHKEIKLSIKASTLKIVRNGMRRCASEGTAKILKENGFDAAAKTGTAPAGNKKTHGWCTGFTPVKNPQLAFCIFIKEGTGFSNAVPVTMEVLELCKKFQYL